MRATGVLATLVSLSLAFFGSHADATKKHASRVLYVGPNPAKAPATTTDRMVELAKERLPAFEAFLKEHFDVVRVVVAEEYDPSMSANYDVTVFDEPPTPMRTRRVNGIAKRLRLPDDFDKPALFVGKVGPEMLGQHGLDLKLDSL